MEKAKNFTYTLWMKFRTAAFLSNKIRKRYFSLQISLNESFLLKGWLDSWKVWNFPRKKKTLTFDSNKHMSLSEIHTKGISFSIYLIYNTCHFSHWIFKDTSREFFFLTSSYNMFNLCVIWVVSKAARKIILSLLILNIFSF